MVQWNNARLPRGRAAGFNSRPMHLFFINFLSDLDFIFLRDFVLLCTKNEICLIQTIRLDIGNIREYFQFHIEFLIIVIVDWGLTSFLTFLSHITAASSPTYVFPDVLTPVLLNLPKQNRISKELELNLL